MQEATAEALAPDTAQPVIQEPVETPTESSDDDLGALYDTLSSDETPETEDVAPPSDDKPADEPEKPAETVQEVIAPPSDLPKEVKDAWNDLPEDVREAVARSQRDYTQKLGDQGRLMTGLKPIQDSLVKAVKDLPALQDMTPAEVAEQAFALAKVSADFQTKPVETMMALIDKHGLKEQMQQALSGQAIQNGETIQRLNQTIEGLQRKVAQFENPEYIRNQVTAVTSEQATQSEVEKFASGAEHWGAVETQLPQFIALEQQMQPEASATDILKAAYEAAVSRLVPEASKAQLEVSAMDTEQPDPEKTKAALKAKSVNVKSTPNGKQRVLTEDEALAATWDRLQA